MGGTKDPAYVECLEKAYQVYDQAHAIPRSEERGRAAAFKEAALLFAEAIERDPNEQPVWADLGRVYLEDLDEPVKALQVFAGAAAMFPWNASFQCKVGVSLLAAGNQERGFETFDDIIQRFVAYIGSDNCSANQAGWVAFAMVEAGTSCCFYDAPEKALDFFSAVMQMELGPATYRDHWLKDQEQEERVIQNIRKEAHCRTAFALLLLGRDQEARARLELAGQVIEGIDLDFYKDLGYIYKKLGRNEEAVDAL